jgi:hypothetical protein
MPAVPPEVAGLVRVLAELAAPLPHPVARDGAPFPRSEDWERRSEAGHERIGALAAGLRQLAAVLEEDAADPGLLARDCTRLAGVVRARLAEPLGYPAAARSTPAAVEGCSLPDVAEPPAGRILCAHAGDSHPMHWLQPGERCPHAGGAS